MRPVEEAELGETAATAAILGWPSLRLKTVDMYRCILEFGKKNLDCERVQGINKLLHYFLLMVTPSLRTPL